MALLRHLSILLCIIWKVRVIEWTVAVLWAEMYRRLLQQPGKKTSRCSNTFHSLPAHAARPHTHTHTHTHTHPWDPSLWVDRSTSFSTLSCIMPVHCVGYRQCTSIDCMAASARCVLTRVVLKTEHKQARTPAAIGYRSASNSGEVSSQWSRPGRAKRFLSVSELKIFGTRRLAVFRQGVDLQGSSVWTRSASGMCGNPPVGNSIRNTHILEQEIDIHKSSTFWHTAHWHADVIVSRIYTVDFKCHL